MYADNLPAIAGGREAGAFPKKLVKPRWFVDSDAVVGTLDYGAVRVASATMGYKHRDLDLEHALASIADLPVLEVISGSHILTDLTLGRDEVVHDYLADRSR
jgi:acetoacetate decarboxylase